VLPAGRGLGFQSFAQEKRLKEGKRRESAQGSGKVVANVFDFLNTTFKKETRCPSSPQHFQVTKEEKYDEKSGRVELISISKKLGGLVAEREKIQAQKLRNVKNSDFLLHLAKKSEKVESAILSLQQQQLSIENSIGKRKRKKDMISF
jgi:hypothetical protein